MKAAIRSTDYDR